MEGRSGLATRDYCSPTIPSLSLRETNHNSCNVQLKEHVQKGRLYRWECCMEHKELDRCRQMFGSRLPPSPLNEELKKAALRWLKVSCTQSLTVSNNFSLRAPSDDVMGSEPELDSHINAIHRDLMNLTLCSSPLATLDPFLCYYSNTYTTIAGLADMVVGHWSHFM